MKNYYTYLKNILDYLKYLAAEFLLYNNYLNAIVIGAAVNILTDNGLPGKYAPYIIPVIVQSISKSALKYKNRHMERLLQLPSEREDPVFIMNECGDIILSTGLTLKKFQKDKISNIAQVIGEEGFAYLSYSFYDDAKGNKQTRQIEMFSELYNRWYEIKIKYIFSMSSKYKKEFLIWFTDITELKNQEKRMSDMLKFSDDIISSLPIIIEKYIIDDIYAMLSEPLLHYGYGGVFIGQVDKEEKIKGLAFKYNEVAIVKSDHIKITNKHQDNKVITESPFNFADISVYPSRDEFDRNYPIDENLKSFLDFQIKNFISYKTVDVYVIAFNKKNISPENDKKLFEIVGKNIKAFLTLQDYISTYFLHYLKALNQEFRPSISDVTSN